MAHYGTQDPQEQIEPELYDYPKCGNCLKVIDCMELADVCECEPARPDGVIGIAKCGYCNTFSYETDYDEGKHECPDPDWDEPY